jgi:hypothetical protein
VYVVVRLLVSPCLVPFLGVSASNVPVLMDVQGLQEQQVSGLFLVLMLVTGVSVEFGVTDHSDFITCHYLCPTFSPTPFFGLFAGVACVLCGHAGWWL